MLKSMLVFTVLVVFFLGAQSLTNEFSYISNNPNNLQTELKHVGLLLLANGKVEEAGYMKIPLKVLNEGSLQAEQVSKYKKWDIFDVIGKDFYLSAKVADLGQNGLLRVSFYDYNTKVSKIISKQLNKEQIPRLSSTSYRYTNGAADDMSFTDEDLTFKIENMAVPSNSRFYGRRIQIVSNLQSLNLDLHLNVTSDHEGVITVSLLDKSRHHFYYDSTNGNIPVRGSLSVDGNSYNLNTEETSAGHVYGRGIWENQGHVVKARGQGVLEDGKRFSLILSSGYGDHDVNEATGDAIIIDKYMFKLNAVNVKINEDDLMQPIKFDTLFNKKKNFMEAHVTFTPSHVENQDLNGDGETASAKIIIGKFSGYVTDFKNKKTKFEDLNGAVDILKMKF